MNPSPSAPPPVSKKKRTAAVLWAVGLVSLGCCFLGAIAGPKFATFKSRSRDAQARAAALGAADDAALDGGTIADAGP